MQRHGKNNYGNWKVNWKKKGGKGGKIEWEKEREKEDLSREKLEIDKASLKADA